MLARKAAVKRTKIFSGWNSGKHYHGDLMERAMALLLGLTGNWGKKGTGTRSWAIAAMDGLAFLPAKGQPGQDAAREFQKQTIAMRRLLTMDDPTMTMEMTFYRAQEMGAARLAGFGGMIPPVFLWYHHYGYKERWNRKDWGDPTMKRTFDEYYQEARPRRLLGHGLYPLV